MAGTKQRLEQKIATRELRWQGLGWLQGALTLWAPPNWLPPVLGAPRYRPRAGLGRGAGTRLAQEELAPCEERGLIKSF